MKRIAIIGGGAAGLAAAISAGRTCKQRNEKAEIIVFESADRIGKSIMASGNGRCNFSNKKMEAETYFNATFVEEAYQVLPPSKVLDFFKQIGLFFSEESEGRLYPLTNKANTVLDVLRFALEDISVTVICNCAIHAVVPVDGLYVLTHEKGQTDFFDAVIVACGGSVVSHVLPTTYLYSEPHPLLGPLKTDTDYLRGLNNIRVKCAVSLVKSTQTIVEEGEVLFREYGVSGIAIFNLSRYAEPGDVIHIDLLSHYSKDQLEGILQDRLTYLENRNALEFCAGIVQPAIARAILKKVDLLPDAPLKKENMAKLAQAFKDFSLIVDDIGDVRQCQIKRGGFKIDCFDSHTMQSKIDPGLFIVGESLDVDGPCGGYNLHWAWASGIIAGRATIEFLAERISS